MAPNETNQIAGRIVSPIDRHIEIMRAKLHYLEGLADGLGCCQLRKQVEGMRKLLGELEPSRTLKS